jgi:hypothetical protein
MKTALAALIALFVFVAPAFSQKRRPPPHKKPKPASAKTWKDVEKDLDRAVDKYHDAGRDCADATREYDHVAFGGGVQGDLGAKRSRLSSAKHSACNKKMGAETEILSACTAATKWLDQEIAEAKAEGDDEEVKELEKHKATVAKLRSRHQMGHTINPHKR